jgi:hypothetical protein
LAIAENVTAMGIERMTVELSSADGRSPSPINSIAGHRTFYILSIFSFAGGPYTEIIHKPGQ